MNFNQAKQIIDSNPSIYISSDYKGNIVEKTILLDGEDGCIEFIVRVLYTLDSRYDTPYGETDKIPVEQHIEIEMIYPTDSKVKQYIEQNMGIWLE